MIKLSTEELKKWVGAYQFDNDVVRYITLKDNQLYSKREGSSIDFKIYPTSATNFSFEDGFIEYEFSDKGGKKEAHFKNRINKEKGVWVNKKAPKEKKEIKVAADILKKYEGAYELQPNFIITIRTKNDQIFAQATGQPEFEIFAETNKKFFLKVVKASIEFHTNDAGVVDALTLYQGGRAMKAKKK